MIFKQQFTGKVSYVSSWDICLKDEIFFLCLSLLRKNPTEKAVKKLKRPKVELKAATKTFFFFCYYDNPILTDAKVTILLEKKRKSIQENAISIPFFIHLA